ncbi:hypothetical protein COCNU_03G005390 [Cocos nucifera]|uniref:Uncharacterized protein n=1 Tax=Cocos nucifera TaxID=13894 RepID=A0A8K0MYG2_COCNU|nr:hypothetical protein COCNU_03G005390 [Cocos nucifera]
MPSLPAISHHRTLPPSASTSNYYSAPCCPPPPELPHQNPSLRHPQTRTPRSEGFIKTLPPIHHPLPPSPLHPPPFQTPRPRGFHKPSPPNRPFPLQPRPLPSSPSPIFDFPRSIPVGSTPDGLDASAFFSINADLSWLLPDNTSGCLRRYQCLPSPSATTATTGALFPETRPHRGQHRTRSSPTTDGSRSRFPLPGYPSAVGTIVNAARPSK